MSRGLAERIRILPKAELHVHLEGTVSPRSLERIAARNRIELPSDVAGMFACHDFKSFLNSFLRVVSVLCQPVDFAEIAFEYLAASSQCGVRHVEFLISPGTQRKFIPQLNLDDLIEAIDGACERARAAFGISSLLVLDMVRNLGAGSAFQDIELALRHRMHRVAGVGLGGDEVNFPAREFSRPFAYARACGLRTTAHAGEAAGPESIVEAVELLRAERIGHAVAARGRPDVLALLKRRGIGIEACITSNYRTGSLPPDESHPLGQFVSENLDVSLSSDDPSFFGSSLLDEYARAGALGLNDSQLVQVARNSFTTSFAGRSLKTRWLAEVEMLRDSWSPP